MNRNVAGTVVTVLALGIAGCGASGPLSKADFMKQATAICKHRTEQITAAMARHKRDLHGVEGQVLPVVSKDLDKLQALRPPAAIKRAYDEIMAIERAQLARIERAFKQNTAIKGETTAQIHRQGRLKVKLGLTACL